LKGNIVNFAHEIAMKQKILSLLIVTFFVTVALFIPETWATPPGPPPMGMGPPCWPPPCNIPVDGGIGFLVAAGLAYAGKTLWNMHKKNPS
jgi:hypothetical protein